MRTVNLLFPVEGIMRELDFRLVLAAKIAEKRHRIFIGQTFNLLRLMTQLEGGVFVGKAVSMPWPRDVLRLRDPHVGRLTAAVAAERGFPIVHLSEEGAVFPGGERDWGPALDFQVPPVLFEDNVDVLTWGEWQQRYYRETHPHHAHRVHSTGHPRFDLHRPEYRDLFQEDVEAIQRRLGRFVLINTNFVLANHPQGQHFAFSKHEGYFPEDDVLRERFVQTWSRIHRSMASFVELVHVLASRRKNVQFVIRPHPSENADFYRTTLAGVPNVHVLREGTVMPWLMAASVVVHDGCTTGMEAYLLDRPVVNYRPIADPDTDLYLPSQFGVLATTRDEAADAVDELIAAGGTRPTLPRREDLPELACSLLHNFRHRSFPLVVDQIVAAEARIRGDGRGVDDRRIKLDETAAQAVELAKRSVRPLFRDRYLSAKHARTAFYGLDRQWLARRLARIERIVGRRVAMKHHSADLIEITSA